MNLDPISVVVGIGLAVVVVVVAELVATFTAETFHDDP